RRVLFRSCVDPERRRDRTDALGPEPLEEAADVAGLLRALPADELDEGREAAVRLLRECRAAGEADRAELVGLDADVGVGRQRDGAQRVGERDAAVAELVDEHLGERVLARSLLTDQADDGGGEHAAPSVPRTDTAGNGQPARGWLTLRSAVHPAGMNPAAQGARTRRKPPPFPGWGSTGAVRQWSSAVPAASQGKNSRRNASTDGSAMMRVIAPATATTRTTAGASGSKPPAATTSGTSDARPTTRAKTVRTVARHGRRAWVVGARGVAVCGLLAVRGGGTGEPRPG